MPGVLENISNRTKIDETDASQIRYLKHYLFVELGMTFITAFPSLSNLTTYICEDHKAGDYIDTPYGCEFPAMHPGWGGETPLILDCSSTVAAESPVDHTVKCTIYCTLSFILLCMNSLGASLTLKKGVGLDLQAHCLKIGVLFSIAGIIATSDVDASAGRLPYVFYHTCTSIQGAMLVIMVVTINKYLIDALKSKGANKDSKDMFYMMKQASVVIVITFEVLFVILENLIESEVGVVNGTVQAFRNLITGLVLLCWMVSLAYSTFTIVGKLGNDDASKRAQAHLKKNCYIITFCCFVGAAVKVLSFMGALGKTLYARPTCEGEDFFHFNHVQLTFFGFLIPMVCLPKVLNKMKKLKSKVNPSTGSGAHKASNATTTVSSSTSSEAP